jgi:hypothetical protein
VSSQTRAILLFQASSKTLTSQMGYLAFSYIPRHIYRLFLPRPNLPEQFSKFRAELDAIGLILYHPSSPLYFQRTLQQIHQIHRFRSHQHLAHLNYSRHSRITQFGYRFSLDFNSLLMLFVAKGIGENLGWQEKALIILSVLVNLWGVVSIIGFNFVCF